MKPGEVRIADGKKTVYVTVGLWLGKDGQIHMSFGDDGLTTVSDKPDSVRAHPHLYQKLTRVLQRAERMG